MSEFPRELPPRSPRPQTVERRSRDPQEELEEDDDSELVEVPIPTSASVLDAIEDLEMLWQRLVPRSSKPANKGLYERLRRQLMQMHDFVEAHATRFLLDQAGDSIDEDDELPLVAVMRIVRSLSPEQWYQVQILMKLRELTDV